jgi:hypothetical protein
LIQVPSARFCIQARIVASKSWLMRISNPPRSTGLRTSWARVWGDVEGVEGDDAARVGGVEADRPVPVGHREHALGVSRQKRLGIEPGGVHCDF